MKNLVLLIPFIVLTINLSAQFDYDCIDRNEYSLIKSSSDLKSATKIKAYELKNSKIAELQFGREYSDKRQFAETQSEYFNYLDYKDGLKLNIPENQRLNIGFHVTSDKYILRLANGQTIKVGMKSEEFKSVFPKSYSKGTVSKQLGKTGKIAVIVYFMQIIDNKALVEDNWISFIFNENNGILEEFYTVMPS